MRVPTPWRGAHALAAVALAAPALAVCASPASAAPAPVPCTPISGARYDCQFYPSGDGISGGAPVQASDSSLVGYLNQGTNWVLCQRTGGSVVSGPYENNWWAWTQANNGRWGWVNAVWAQGGDNFGAYSVVPACGNDVGPAPGAQTPPASGASSVGSPPAPASGASGQGGTGGGGGGHTGPLRRERLRIAVDWSRNASITRLTHLSFGRLPRRARIAVSCRGRRCRFRTGAVSAARLRRELIHQAFSSGETLRLTVTAPGYRPLVAELRFRAEHGPVGRLLSR